MPRYHATLVQQGPVGATVHLGGGHGPLRAWRQIWETRVSGTTDFNNYHLRTIPVRDALSNLAVGRGWILLFWQIGAWVV